MPAGIQPAEAARIFDELARVDQLRGRDRDAFSRGLAWVWGETTALHPFRDVNTRSQFVFFNQLADAAGWAIDWSRIDPRLFAHARTVAIIADESGIDALVYPALQTIAERDQVDAMTAVGQPSPGSGKLTPDFFASQPSRTPEQLDALLLQAVRQRADGA